MTVISDFDHHPCQPCVHTWSLQRTLTVSCLPKGHEAWSKNALFDTIVLSRLLLWGILAAPGFIGTCNHRVPLLCVVNQGVVGISDIIVKPGLINVDFADVR